MKQQTLHTLQALREKISGRIGKTIFAFLGLAALAAGSRLLFGSAVTVSNTVDGRELPIYCVQTEEKKIALTFDAAWGNDRY